MWQYMCLDEACSDISRNLEQGPAICIWMGWTRQSHQIWWFNLVLCQALLHLYAQEFC